MIRSLVALVVSLTSALVLMVSPAVADVPSPVTWSGYCTASPCGDHHHIVDASASDYVEFAVHCTDGPVGDGDMWFHAYRSDGSVIGSEHPDLLGEDGFEWQLANAQPNVSVNWGIDTGSSASCHWEVYVGPVDGKAASVLTGY